MEQVKQIQKPEEKKPTAIEQARGEFGKMENQFKAVLPPHITIEKFMRVVLTAIQQNAELLSATRKSLFSACMRAAQDGLIPDGREAALIVYNVNTGSKQAPKYELTVQYMPMVQGILKKCRNSGEIASITAQVVCKNDKFRYWVDHDGEHLDHEPLVFGDRGDFQGVYGLCKTKDGAIYIEVMNKDQIEQVRDVSKAKNSGPWTSWYGEMARKSVIRRLAKRLPSSTDLEQTLEADNDNYDFKQLEESNRSISKIEQLFPDEPPPVAVENPPVPELIPGQTFDSMQ